MSSYFHGGDVEAFAKIYNFNQNEVIDLSSNINHLKPNIKLDFSSVDLSIYPKYDDLKKDISTFYNVKYTNISLFNGASSAIFFLLNYLDFKKSYIYSPAYLEYKKSLENKEVIFVDRFCNLDKTIEKNSLVIFVNPSTPDGKYYNIEKLFDKWVESNCIIFIDESFLEFVKNKSSLINKINIYDKLYILKSMTKIFSCAGVRVGSIISNDTNIIKIENAKAPWQISALDSYYIKSVLKDKKHIQNTLIEINTNKTILLDFLNKYNYIDKIFESDTNFLLIKLKDNNNNIIKHLAKYKIMVRDCSNFDFLDNSYIRIAIKDINSINKLKEALDVF